MKYSQQLCRRLGLLVKSQCLLWMWSTLTISFGKNDFFKIACFRCTFFFSLWKWIVFLSFIGVNIKFNIIKIICSWLALLLMVFRFIRKFDFLSYLSQRWINFMSIQTYHFFQKYFTHGFCHILCPHIYLCYVIVWTLVSVSFYAKKISLSNDTSGWL